MVGGGVGESEGEENVCTETVDGSNNGAVEENMVLVVGESGSVVEGTIMVSMVTKCGGCVTTVCSCVLRLEGRRLSMVEECITCIVLERSDVRLNASLEVKSSSCGLSVACGLLDSVSSKTVLVCKLGCGPSAARRLLVTVGSSTRLLTEVGCGVSVACGVLVTVSSSTVLTCEWIDVGCEPSAARRLLVTVISSTRLLAAEVGCGVSVGCGLLVTVGSSTVLVCTLMKVGCGLSVACGTIGSSVILVCELTDVGWVLAVARGLLVTVVSWSSTVLVCKWIDVGCESLVNADSSTRLLVEIGCGLSVASGLFITVGSSMILVCEWMEVGCGLLVTDREGERGVESATKTRR